MLANKLAKSPLMHKPPHMHFLFYLATLSVLAKKKLTVTEKMQKICMCNY